MCDGIIAEISDIKNSFNSVLSFRNSFGLLIDRIDMIYEPIKALHKSGEEDGEDQASGLEKLTNFLLEFHSLLQVYWHQEWYMCDNKLDLLLTRTHFVGFNDSLTKYCEFLPRYGLGNFNIKKEVVIQTTNVDMELLSEELTQQGLFAEQEEIFRFLLRKVPNEPLFASCVANALVGRNFFDEAESFYQQAVYNRRKLSGEDHPAFAQEMMKLAKFYFDMEKYPKAEPLFKQCLQIFRKIHGEEHTDTATALHSVADIYFVKGDFAEAEPLLVRALQIMRKTVGDSDIRSVKLMIKVVTVYQYQNQASVQHEDLYRLAYHQAIVVFGENSLDSAQAAFNLGHFMLGKGKNSEALQLFDQCLIIRKSILGDLHTETNHVMYRIAMLHEKMGNLDGAVEVLAKVVMRRRSTLGSSHKETILAAEYLEKLRDEQKRRVVAQAWMKKKGEKGLIKTWKTRWFVMTGESIKYFTKEGVESSYKGCIDLKAVMDIKRPQANILYICTYTRIYKLQSDDRQQYEQWANLLTKVAENNKQTGYSHLKI